MFFGFYITVYLFVLAYFSCLFICPSLSCPICPSLSCPICPSLSCPICPRYVVNCSAFLSLFAYRHGPVGAVIVEEDLNGVNRKS